jgi:beta-glucanase (GH16 family)
MKKRNAILVLSGLGLFALASCASNPFVQTSSHSAINDSFTDTSERSEGSSQGGVSASSQGTTSEGTSSRQGGTSSSSSSSQGGSSSTSATPSYVPAGYSLSWSDEFSGSSLNTSNWERMIGDGSSYGVWRWGNNEQEYYTANNDEVTGGNLVITAKKETVSGYSYTSTRLRSKGKVFTTYGYIEARIKLPTVQGMWPAFWMLPENTYSGIGWPCSGEIDIMEAKGRLPQASSGALHYASDGTTNSHTYKTASHTTDSIANWHVYSVLWTNQSMIYSVDGSAFLTVSESTWNAGYGTGDGAPFNADFHLLLNLAVGGNFDNSLLPPSDFSSCAMNVDYVRIYKK